MHQLNAMEKNHYRHTFVITVTVIYVYIINIVTVMTVTVMMFLCLALCQERCAWKHVMPASAMVACTHIGLHA